MAIAKNITELIGNTPLVVLGKIAGDGAEVLAKLESFNPCGSIKDRIALAMIEDAERRGLLDKDTTVVEATSGNTGIGLAFVCAQRGYRLVFDHARKHVGGAPEPAKNAGSGTGTDAPRKKVWPGLSHGPMKCRGKARCFCPGSLKTPANPDVHSRTTAEEIWRDTEGRVDIFVAGVGTGGTLTGTARVLKQRNPDIAVIAVEPQASPVLSGGAPGPHRIQGIGAGFVPKVLDQSLIDEVVQVANNDAIETALALGKKQEGILAGISSGAAVYAARQVALRKENRGKRVVVILPDTGERYLSVLSSLED